MKDSKTTTYDLDLNEPAPAVGMYLVGLSVSEKMNVLSVNLIQSVRVVKPRKPRNFVRYELKIVTCFGLAEYTVAERVWLDGSSELGWTYTAAVWVRGEPALPFFWTPRGKQKPR